MQLQAYERPLTLFDILSAVFRYKWRVLCVAGLMLLLSAAAVLVFPKKYESEAKLFVRLGRGSAAMDPATFGQTISIQESRESEMNSIVDMLQSRGLAERVVDQVGVEPVLKNYSWIELQLEEVQNAVASWMEDTFPNQDESVNEGGLTATELKAERRREVAIKKLQGRLKIESPKKSTTITIAYRGAAPEIARDVVQAVIDCYQQMHIEAYRSGGAVDFFDQQFAQQEELLVRAEEILRSMKNENAVVTMRGKQDSLQAEITSVENMQLQTQAELQAARGRLVKLQSDLQALPVQLETGRTSGLAVGATDAMRDRLYELEIREKEFASKYSDSHPELIKLRGQLRAARTIMDEQPTEREQTTLSINPVYQQIQNEMLLAEASVASLESKSAALDTLERTLLQGLNDVNDLELVSESLQREIDIGRERYGNYARKLEESRINAALDQMSLSNVSIVAPPNLRYKHTSPNRPLLAALGIIFSCCCGLATAIASSYYTTSVENQQVRTKERERYLRTVELEAARAEQATLELRQGLAAKSDDLAAEKEKNEIPVDLIVSDHKN